MKILNQGDTVKLYMARINGALVEVFTNKLQAEAYMRLTRKNGEFWRIHETVTSPHEDKR